MMKVPGAVPVLDRADVYTADDDKFFTFDVDRGLVFFKKELVDLVRKFKFYAVINTFVVRFQLIGCVLVFYVLGFRSASAQNACKM